MSQSTIVLGQRTPFGKFALSRVRWIDSVLARGSNVPKSPGHLTSRNVIRRQYMHADLPQHAIPTLLKSLGISSESFTRFVSWALAEHLIVALAAHPTIARRDFFSQPDALKTFRAILRDRTGRRWSEKDLLTLFDRVKADLTTHHRSKVEYGEYLKLLWQVPLRCATCGKSPPEVVLHIDHVIPASKGGSSKRQNLQFLCAAHNLQKSNNREATELCLDLQ
jgi:hypothetical protein